LKGSWNADRDPLVALRRGDASLFEEFVRDEAGTLTAFFRRLGAGRAEAEDLSQEVFLKLYSSAPNYQAQSAFEPFALRVAKNAWIDRRRRSAARPEPRSLDGGPRDDDEGPSLAETFESREPAPWSGLVRRDEGRRLRHAIARLSAAQAVVFELAVVQRLPYPEIAGVLDIPVGTVKSRVFNAVRALRSALAGPPAPNATAAPTSSVTPGSGAGQGAGQGGGPGGGRT